MCCLNIVVPMAGLGSRFSQAGYTIPKPFIPVLGKPMIQVVMDNVRPKIDYRFILIAQRSHSQKYRLQDLVTKFEPFCTLLEIDEVTQGQLCTVLKARDLINTEDPLMTVNSDQYLDIDINDFLKKAKQEDLDGLIMTMIATKPHYGYVKLDESLKIVETVERNPISSYANAGVYYFKKGSDFVQFGEQMIRDDTRVKGEFYISPLYNYMIKVGKSVGIYNIGTDGENGMHSLGTPEDLEKFISNYKFKIRLGKDASNSLV